MENAKLKELKDAYVGHDSVIGNMSQEEWIAAGEPHCWILVEKHKGFSVMADVAYGRIALFKGDKLLSTGKHSAEDKEAVALDVSYFGLPHYIYVR